MGRLHEVVAGGSFDASRRQHLLAKTAADSCLGGRVHGILSQIARSCLILLLQLVVDICGVGTPHDEGRLRRLGWPRISKLV